MSDSAEPSGVPPPWQKPPPLSVDLATALLDDCLTALQRQRREGVPTGHAQRTTLLRIASDAGSGIELRARAWDALSLLWRWADQPEVAWRCSRVASALIGQQGQHPERPQIILHWAAANVLRYRASGRHRYLDQAITAQRQQVDELADDHPVRPAALTNLSIMLNGRFADRTRKVRDLDEAVAAARQALLLTRADDPDRPSRITNLGAVLVRRFARGGAIADLHEAVEMQRVAVRTSEHRPAHLPMLLANLGQGLRDLYDFTGRRDLLHEALQRHRRALRLARRYAPGDVPQLCQNLGTTQQEIATSRRDIERALALHAEAVRLTPDGTSAYAERLAALASCRLTAARRSFGRGATDDGVGHARAALTSVDAAIEEHGATPWRLMLRAEAAAMLHRRAGEERYATIARTAFRESCDDGLRRNPTIVPAAAVEWGQYAAWRGDWPEAATAFTAGLRALNLMLPRQSQQPHRRAWARLAQSLPPLAAAARLRVGDVDGAILALEQGRFRELTAVAQAYRLRAGGAVPEELAEELAEDLDQRLTAWEEARGDGDDTTLDAAVGPVVERIRGLPDLRTFLLPPTMPDVLRAVAAGPLCYLAASEFGTVILVVRPDGSTHGRLLTRLTERAVELRVARLDRAYRARSARWAAWADEILDTGRWLGRRLAPLLDLATAHPHVTIVPCGGFGALPLAAATDAAGAFPLADGSSTVALNARAHDGSPAPRAGARAACLTARTGTAERTPDGEQLTEQVLADAEAESVALAATAVTRVTGGDGDDPGRAAISALAAVDLVHGALHGVSDDDNPHAYGLALGGRVVLDVKKISGARLLKSPTVILPVCEAAGRDRSAPDEAVNVANAFLGAGASEVVAPILAIPRLAATLLAAWLYPELAAGRTAVEALGTYRRWCRETTDGEKIRHLDAVADRLAASGLPHAQVRRCARLLASSYDRPTTTFSTPPFWALYTHFS
ncbi:CHAT domain-containing protein [Micromonospora sp. NPDC023888]|uniref:CHAT domain-containing protein n=1 Tax=Micromonospora sp. NPDC023888 TaxID=3155607 RepID=UPI0033EE0042